MGPGDRFLGMEGGECGLTSGLGNQTVELSWDMQRRSFLEYPRLLAHIQLGGLTTYSVLLGVPGRSVADSRTLTGDGWTSNTLPVSLSAQITHVKLTSILIGSSSIR